MNHFLFMMTALTLCTPPINPEIIASTSLYKVITSSSVEQLAADVKNYAAASFRLVSAASFALHNSAHFVSIFHPGKPGVFSFVVGLRYQDIRSMTEKLARQYLLLQTIFAYRDQNERLLYAAYFELDLDRKQIVMFVGKRSAGRTQNTGSRFTVFRTVTDGNEVTSIGTLTIPLVGNSHQVSISQIPVRICQRKGKSFKRLGFAPISLQIYTFKNRRYCTSVWERDKNSHFDVTAGPSLTSVSRRNFSTLLPRDVSVFQSDNGQLNFAILWSDKRFRIPGHLWLSSRAVPSTIDRKAITVTNSSVTKIEKAIKTLMTRHQLPTLSLAIAKSGRIVFRGTFGLYLGPTVPMLAQRSPVVMNPLLQLLPKTNPFQLIYPVADISKPITAVAVFLLIQNKTLRLNERVFHTKSLLKKFTQWKEVYGRNLVNVTIEHLLQHTVGAWPISEKSQRLMDQYPELPSQAFISRILDTNPLLEFPGKTFLYSDFTYLLLQTVIEHVSGEKYAKFVRKYVLDKANISSSCLYGEHCSDRKHYYSTFVDVGLKRTGNSGRLYASKGWQLSPEDLLKFLSLVDNRPEPRTDLLSLDLLRRMYTPSEATLTPATGSGYACGWAVGDFCIYKNVNGYHHSGVTSGGGGVMVQDLDGRSFSMLTNYDSPYGDLKGDMYETLHNIVEFVKENQTIS